EHGGYPCGRNATVQSRMVTPTGIHPPTGRISSVPLVQRFLRREGNMRFGESFGEACRFCGSTQIIVWPPSSAGNCAMCSEEAIAWDARLEQAAQRRLAVARAAFEAEEAERRAAERRRRWAAQRAALAQTGRDLARAGAMIAQFGAGRLRAIAA